MNKKGFTLTELLAMLVVLGIITAIAIPNISGVLENNREKIAEDTAVQMYDAARLIESTQKIEKPNIINGCVVMTLNYIDINNDFTTGVNGGLYNKDTSFILIKLSSIDSSSDPTRTKYNYDYYVRLVEEIEENNYYGVKLSKIKTIKVDNFTQNIENLTDSNVKTQINSLMPRSDVCTSVINLYK